jgi:hypothetical protein
MFSILLIFLNFVIKHYVKYSGFRMFQRHMLMALDHRACGNTSDIRWSCDVAKQLHNLRLTVNLFSDDDVFLYRFRQTLDLVYIYIYIGAPKALCGIILLSRPRVRMPIKHVAICP